jgi:hypothetical protein
LEVTVSAALGYDAAKFELTYSYSEEEDPDEYTLPLTLKKRDPRSPASPGRSPNPPATTNGTAIA